MDKKKLEEGGVIVGGKNRKRKKYRSGYWLWPNQLDHLERQVFDRAVYEYEAALNGYALCSRLEDETTDAASRIYLLGHILGNNPQEIDRDIEACVRTGGERDD